ncbi:MAG: cytochrome b [Pseudomonadota bacterium]
MAGMTNVPDRYSSVAKALHWTIALLILTLIPAGLIMHNMPFGETKFLIYQVHKSFGLMVLMLAVFRLVWRLTHPVPPLPENLKAWEKVAARITHVGFYVIMVGIPLIGWAMVSSAPIGIPTKLFFLIPVPHFPLPQSEPLYEVLLSSHKYMAFATLGLLVLHVGAALKHHVVLLDDVLLRMMPRPVADFLDRRRSLPFIKPEDDQA